jgi:hypothetical protein
LRRLVALGHARETLLQNSKESLFFPPMLSVFSPCAMAISGAAPDDVAMRSIGIALKPALALERVEPMPADEAGGPFALLRARAARWARDQGRSVASRTPRLPASLVGSQAGNWRPLLAIAEDAGAAWIEEGRAAATALSQAQATSALGLDLLTDIRTALGAAGRITSDELVTALVADAERPWRRLRGGPVDARRLAQLLRPFGVRPRVIRTGEETFARGYLAADFAEPFARYLPPPASGSACVHA